MFESSATSDKLRDCFAFGYQNVLVLEDDFSLVKTEYIISLLTSFLFDNPLPFQHSFVFFVKIKVVASCFLNEKC